MARVHDQSHTPQRRLNGRLRRRTTSASYRRQSADRLLTSRVIPLQLSRNALKGSRASGLELGDLLRAAIWAPLDGGFQLAFSGLVGPGDKTKPFLPIHAPVYRYLPPCRETFMARRPGAGAGRAEAATLLVGRCISPTPSRRAVQSGCPREAWLLQTMCDRRPGVGRSPQAGAARSALLSDLWRCTAPGVPAASHARYCFLTKALNQAERSHDSRAMASPLRSGCATARSARPLPVSHQKPPPRARRRATPSPREVHSLSGVTLAQGDGSTKP